MLFQDIIQKPSPVPHVCQIVKGRMVKFTTAESKPRWGSTWGLVTSSSPYQASLRAYLWLTLCASWHPDPEVGVRDGSTWAIGLQPTQGSLQEFKLLQEILLPEGAGVHWQEGEQADDEFCLHGEPCLHSRDHPEEKSSWCHRRQPLVSLILTILIHWQLTDMTDMRPEASTLTPKFWLRTCASSGVIWEMATEYWYLPYVMVQKLELHWRIPDFSGNLAVDTEMLISYVIKGH